MQVETLVLKAAFTSKYTTNRGKVKGISNGLSIVRLLLAQFYGMLYDAKPKFGLRSFKCSIIGRHT